MWKLSKTFNRKELERVRQSNTGPLPSCHLTTICWVIFNGRPSSRFLDSSKKEASACGSDPPLRRTHWCVQSLTVGWDLVMGRDRLGFELLDSLHVKGLNHWWSELGGWQEISKGLERVTTPRSLPSLVRESVGERCIGGPGTGRGPISRYPQPREYRVQPMDISMGAKQHITLCALQTAAFQSFTRRDLQHTVHRPFGHTGRILTSTTFC